MRAPTVSCCALEIVMPGAIAMLSSSLKASGRSATLARSTASGMRPPLAARANTNTVSPGARLGGERGSSVTVPLTPGVAPLRRPAHVRRRRRADRRRRSRPARSRASAMLAWTCL